MGRIASVDKELFSERVGARPADMQPGRILIEIDPSYVRPAEADMLVGDFSKAREKLGWRPRRCLGDLVKEMMTADLEVMKREANNGLQKADYFAYSSIQT